MSNFENIIIETMREEVKETVCENKFFTKQTIHSCIRGLLKNQDFAVCGTSYNYNEKDYYDWGVLLDGHGTDNFIDKMRTLDWDFIMRTIEPWETLEKILMEIIDLNTRFSSGSTLLMMKAFSDRIETWSIGDSQIIIYKNEGEVYKSTPHNLNNPKEVERLNNVRPGTWWSEKMSSPVFQIRSSTSLQAREATYIFFNQETQLAMSQSIGHNNITGYEPEKNVLYFTPEDKITCILGSDGLFDMTVIDLSVHPTLTEKEEHDFITDKMDLLRLSADELVAKAEARWKQQWNYKWDLKDFTKSYDSFLDRRSYDDISVIVWKQE